MRKNLYVLKFGGTSLGNVKRIEEVAKIVISYVKKGIDVVCVVSAMGDTTDRLINLAKEINPFPSEREMDMLISTGEQVSSALLAMALHKKGYDALSFVGYQVGIITDTSYTQARILKIETKKILNALRKKRIVIVAGFQGVTENGEITTLGRGGSDLSAVALACSLKAERCVIYTDVEGIYTADPRLVKEAKKLRYITFDEMLELAFLGAQVMQARAVEVAKKFNMPIEVRSSFARKEGTIIMGRAKFIEEPEVRGVALTENEAKLTICNVPDKPGIAASIFNELAKNNINVDMIVQNVSHKKITDISFTVPKNLLSKAEKVSRKIAQKIGATEVLSDCDIAKVSVVGVGMRSHPGVAAKCFSALAKRKINIEMISTSEISISCVVRKKEGKKALEALHKEFNLGRIRK